MPSEDKNIQTFLRHLYESNWNAANTRDILPFFTTGWMDNDRYTEPQLVITTPNESSLRGGDTGFTGQSSSGNPMRIILGTVVVQCVAQEGLEGVNPKDMTFDMKEEVKRITDANLLNPNNHFDWISWFGSNEAADTVRRPITLRQDCLIRYKYLERVLI